MARVFEILHRSGARIEVPVNDAEILIGNDKLDDGEKNPLAGQLVGYNLDTEDLGIPIFWARIENIDAVVLRD